HLMDAAEFLEPVTRFAELAENGSVELHLVDFARRSSLIEIVAGGEGVRRVEILMRTLRDANGPRRADVIVDRLLIEIVVEDDDARVAAIGNVDHALRVDRN